MVRSAYADDVQLISRLARDGQVSVEAFRTACTWSYFCLKVRKCRSLAYRKFVTGQKDCEFIAHQNLKYSCYNPLLMLGGEKVPFVGDDDIPIFKYLGRKIQLDFRDDIIRDQISDLLSDSLGKVDK